MVNLIIVGDPFHPPETQAPSLTAILASIGIESDVEEDVEAGCRKLAGGKYDMLTFSAARWRMLNETSGSVNPEAIPPPSHPDPRWALSLSESGREAIRKHLRGGGASAAPCRRRLDSSEPTHPNQPGQRDQFRNQPPFRLELSQGICIYPKGRDFPRLPLLGLRTLIRNKLHFSLDAERCLVDLRTPDWRTMFLRWFS